MKSNTFPDLIYIYDMCPTFTLQPQSSFNDSRQMMHSLTSTSGPLGHLSKSSYFLDLIVFLSSVFVYLLLLKLENWPLSSLFLEFSPQSVPFSLPSCFFCKPLLFCFFHLDLWRFDCRTIFLIISLKIVDVEGNDRRGTAEDLTADVK